MQKAEDNDKNANSLFFAGESEDFERANIPIVSVMFFVASVCQQVLFGVPGDCESG